MHKIRNAFGALLMGTVFVAFILRNCHPFEMAAFAIKSGIWLEIALVNEVGSDNGVSLDDGLNQQFDFVVVGAGTAGCVIASRLTENTNWTVLLIEAGPGEGALMDVPVFAINMQALSAINWEYKTEPSADNSFCAGMVGGRCNYPRGKVMGGSSVLNFMVYTRGHPNDYDRWAELGNDGWSYADVEPLFDRIENMLVPNEPRRNVSALLSISLPNFQSGLAKQFLQATAENGLPPVSYNSKLKAGADRLQSTTHEGLRVSSNRAYIRPFRQRKNLHTRTDSLVTRILIDESTRQATGVELLVNGKLKQVYASKEVILSAGAINSPQLLMLSGVGDADHLRSHGIRPIVDNKNVGANLMDHISPEMFHVKTNSSTIYINDLFFPKTWYSYIKTGDTLISTAGGAESIVFLSDEPNGEFPDIEILQITGGLHSTRDTLGLTNYHPDIYERSYSSLRQHEGNVIALVMFPLRPRSRGTIQLHSNDPQKHPHIHPNYYSDPYDMQITLRGIRQMQNILATPTMQSLNAELADCTVPACRHLTYNTDDYWRCQARHLTYTIYHYSGTCRMGTNASAGAVVDSALRVHGVRGLRVADASIMPELVSGHPNAAVFMIAEKAAAMVANDWR